MINFSAFLERLWYKYHYNVMKMINKKFRPRTDFKLLDELDPFFEDLPESCIFNVNEYGFFQDYVYSDMLIETIRAAKLKSITDHVRDPRLRNELMEEAIAKILDPDEIDSYNNLLMEVKIENRWGPAQDAEYEKRMYDSWTQRSRGL